MKPVQDSAGWRGQHGRTAPDSDSTPGSTPSRGKTILAACLVVAALVVVFRTWSALGHSPEALARRAVGSLGLGEPAREAAFGDPVTEILFRITARRFESRSEVMTERAEQDFERIACILDGVDCDEMSILHRGRGWAQVQATYEPGPYDAPCYDALPGNVRLTFVEHDGRWKLDRLKIREQGI